MTEISRNIKDIISQDSITGVMAFNYNSTLAAINTLELNVNLLKKNIEIIDFDFLLPIQEYGLYIYTYNQPHFEMERKAVEIIMDEIRKSKSREVKPRVKLSANLQPVSLKAARKIEENIGGESLLE